MEALRKELEQYPSSFKVTENVKALSTRNLIQIKDKLLLELCSIGNEFSTSMEKVRVWNLLSYLYYVLGDYDNAYRYNQAVFVENPNNVIALANKAWFSLKERKNLTVCQDSLKILKVLKSNSLAYLMAKAELAFTYSRFGLRLYHIAISMFKKLTEEVNTLSEEELTDKCTMYAAGNKQDTPVELKCVWLYGYALTLKRLLHNCNVSEKDSVEDIRARHISVFEIFESVVREEGESECLLRYKARALVEAGILAYGVDRNKTIFKQGMKGLLPRNSAILMPVYKYFEEALTVFPNDYFVLERCGRYFRYIDDIERSILLLKTSVEIKGTSFGYHHLALSYIRLLEYNPKKMKYCLDSVSKQSDYNMTLLSQKTPRSPGALKEDDVSASMNILRLDVDNLVTKEIKQTRLQLAQDFKRSDKLVQDCQNIAKQSNLNPMAEVFVPGQSTRSTRKNQKFQDSSDVSKRNDRFTQKHDKGSSLKCMVKCYRFPRNIDHDRYVIDIIISHLDAATRISPNLAALYHKAVLYRKVSQTWKALEVLESLMQNDENCCSPVLLANVYEQAAYCIDDILKGNEKIDAGREKQLINDRQIYLKSSIEVSCNIIDKLPYLGHCWRSSITLRNILLCELDFKRTKETLKELWNLYCKMKNIYNEEIIDVLRELKELTDDDADKREICEEIVKRYLFDQNYEEAVIALSMLDPLDSFQSSVCPNLFSQVYVESGLNAFHRKNFDKARLLIGKAFAKPIDDIDTVDNLYDVFILSNLDDEEHGKTLMLLLNNLGLNTTFNSDSMSILPGTSEIEGMTKVMSMSNAFVILVNWELDSIKMLHLVDRMRVIVEERQSSDQIYVVTKKEMHLPSTCCLSTYSRLNLELEKISDSDPGNKANYEGLKQLLLEMSTRSRNCFPNSASDDGHS